MLTMVFWDVQHGHALYVRTETRNIVIDLGTGSHGASDKTFSPLLHLKNQYGVEQLDAVMITHPHGDHLYDIVNLDLLSPKVLYRPRHLTEEDIRKGNAAADKPYIEKYLELDQRYTQPVADRDNPLRPENNGGVTFQLFTPKKTARTNLNNHSMVTVISHASLKAIIPGDNESPSWNELLEDEAFRTAIKGADLLLAPHHGREAGYSEALFEHLSPYLTIVSDGAATDTSATDKYSKKSRGWKVHRRGGEPVQRKCVTTRNDGVIVVKFGIGDEKRPFIYVSID